MKGGVTKKIEDTLAALDKKQLKKALYLTDNKGLERHHEIVQQAARTCLADKSNKGACEKAMKEARNAIQDTISLPFDDTSLEGLEDYLSPQSKSVEPKETEPTNEKTDEELYENCPECHISSAILKFSDTCNENPEEAGDACKVISEKVEANTEPVEWIRTLVQITEQAKGKAKQEMQESLTELTDYLEKKQSPWLKELDKGGE